jgi:tetratricopeptide (TPR) repeat protein
MNQTSMLVAAGLLASLASFAQTPDDCQAFRHHGKQDQARQCFTGLSRSTNPAIAAEGYWGLDDYQQANTLFRTAAGRDKASAAIRVRWGMLFLERFNPQEAANLFQEALLIDRNNADAYLGLAKTAAEGFENKAEEFAKKAIQLNPKLVAAQEFLAYLALEDNNVPRASEQAEKALQISPEALDALSVLATIDWMADKTNSPWADRIWKINPSYGQAYSTAGHFFVINRRYREGIQFYRKALQLEPNLWEARSQLGANLMRLGDYTAARQELEKAYAAGYRNAQTGNSLRLLDSYKNYETFRSGDAVLRLQKKESALLKLYFQPELERDIAYYERKYQMKLKEPVQLEVYPDHEDFAVRTMGLPGLGALGATFDTVVAMDSPSARPPGEFHWATTLRHEMSHVFVLTATDDRVPRWFAEGLAVHEETVASPDWGDRMTPDVIAALQQKKLLPLLDLDKGFVRPSYPDQVVVSYFEAGKICDYISHKWGDAALLGMIHSFANHKNTTEAIQENLHLQPAAFDQMFLTWIDGQTKNTVQHFDEWKKRAKGLPALAKQQRYDDVIREGTAIRDWYPDYVEENSVYEMLADAYLAKGDKKDAISQLERYRDIGGRNPATLKKLAQAEQQAGNAVAAIDTLIRLNYIYPEDGDLHKRLGDLLMAAGKTDASIREYKAVLAWQPVDPANSHYELARALNTAHRAGEARDEVLQALEVAPNYKPAQQLLLQLTK